MKQIVRNAQRKHLSDAIVTKKEISLANGTKMDLIDSHVFVIAVSKLKIQFCLFLTPKA